MFFLIKKLGLDEGTTSWDIRKMDSTPKFIYMFKLRPASRSNHQEITFEWVEKDPFMGSGPFEELCELYKLIQGLLQGYVRLYKASEELCKTA